MGIDDFQELLGSRNQGPTNNELIDMYDQDHNNEQEFIDPVQWNYGWEFNRIPQFNRKKAKNPYLVPKYFNLLPEPNNLLGDQHFNTKLWCKNSNFSDMVAVAKWLLSSAHVRLAMSSSQVPLKTCWVKGKVNVKSAVANKSLRWHGVVLKRMDYQVRCRPFHLAEVQNYEVLLLSCCFIMRR
ncbi:hypothetical protein TNCV_1058201 [Trichonephila clavipes]|nr:hypothetical protein TNCV_1058201 [Trichonephila clavipes]